ncbi:hypothetical protein JCM8547_008490 [Rhodosporidiobolus lusitaniae]
MSRPRDDVLEKNLGDPGLYSGLNLIFLLALVYLVPSFMHWREEYIGPHEPDSFDRLLAGRNLENTFEAWLCCSFVGYSECFLLWSSCCGALHLHELQDAHGNAPRRFTNYLTISNSTSFFDEQPADWQTAYLSARASFIEVLQCDVVTLYRINWYGQRAWAHEAMRSRRSSWHFPLEALHKVLERELDTHPAYKLLTNSPSYWPRTFVERVFHPPRRLSLHPNDREVPLSRLLLPLFVPV